MFQPGQEQVISKKVLQISSDATGEETNEGDVENNVD